MAPREEPTVSFEIRIRPVDVPGVGLRWAVVRGGSTVVEVATLARAKEIAHGVWPDATVLIEESTD